METKEILTICIPTYNRKDKIQSQVRAILPQLTEHVKLVVIDNNSMYDVGELFTLEEKKHFQILINKFNIGADANIAKSFEICESRWLWILSDDDLVKPTSVNIVLQDIERYNSCVFINYNRNETVLCNDFVDFLTYGKRAYSKLFWMSVCIYNVDLLKCNMYYYYGAISTMQPGVPLLVKTISEKNYPTLFSSDIIIEEDSTDISWDRKSFIYSSLYLMDYWSLYRSDLDNTFNKEIVNMCFTSILLRFQSKRNIAESFSLLSIVVKRRGIFALCRYDLYNLCRFVLVLMKYWILNK